MISAEEIAKREISLLERPDRVSVVINLTNRGGLLLPRASGEIEERATFKIWTYGDDSIINNACQYKIKNEYNGKDSEQTDFNEVKRLMIKRCLIDWSLPIPIERENGWMTSETYSRVSRVSAPIIEAFSRSFERSFSVTESESETINRQCAMLFSPSGRGVSNACEAVSMFCSYGNFNDKFGIDKDDLARMPFKEYQMLKIVMSNEGEAMSRAKKKNNNAPNTRVAGAGGRIRPSRATRIAM